MRSLAQFFMHLLVLVARSLKHGGVKSVFAENLLLKQQLIVLNRKYSRLFSNKGIKRPDPKRPSRDLINAIVELNRQNPRIGYPLIA